MMEQLKRYVITAAGLALAAACQTTIKAEYDYDRNASFQSHATYAWINEHPMIVNSSSRAPSPLLEGRIQRAIEDSLNTKGYTLTNDPELADLTIAFTVGARDTIQVDSYPSAYRSSFRRGGVYLGTGSDVVVSQYTEGWLAIDLFDVRRHEPVWHGWAEDRISSSDRQDPDAKVRTIVNAILANFPPPVDAEP